MLKVREPVYPTEDYKNLTDEQKNQLIYKNLVNHNKKKFKRKRNG
jgi:hypothetical protein